MNTLFKKTGRLFLLSLLLFSIAFHNNASAQAKQKKPQIKSFSKKLFVGKSYYVKVKNRPKKSTLSYSLSKTSRAKINKKTGKLTTRKSGKITIRVRIKSKNRKYKSLHKSVQIYEHQKFLANSCQTPLLKLVQRSTHGITLLCYTAVVYCCKKK